MLLMSIYTANNCLSTKCIAELQYKAKLFEEHNFVEAIDGIFKSDSIIPEELRQSLLRAVVPLETVPDKKKDWHPGSDEQVLDLVHPSLFPLVYGQSRILPHSVVSIQDCLEACGGGEIVPVPSDEEIKDPRGLIPRSNFTEFFGINLKAWSKKYQWLPSEFQIHPDNDDVRYVACLTALIIAHAVPQNYRLHQQSSSSSLR